MPKQLLSLSILLDYDFDSLLISHGLDTMKDAKKKIKNLI